MSRSRKDEKAEMLVMGMRKASRLVTKTRRIFLPGLDRPDEQPDQRAELRYTIARMRRLLREAMGDGNDQEFVDLLSTLARNGDQIEQAIIVWIDLIEVLVQNTERRYGAQPGRGSIKTAEVKQVVRYFLQTDRLNLDIPFVPRYLVPVILDIIVEWMIDAIVLMSNRYGMWSTAESEPQSINAIILLVLNRIYNFFRPLLDRLGWLINRIWFAFRVQAPLSPAIRSAIDAVEREGLIHKSGEKPLLESLVDLFVWIGTHRDQLVAALELVFAAVQEAEKYVTMSGSEKRVFAHNLVLAVLDDLGFEERFGLMFAIVDSVVNGTIEASVNMFNKRGVFTHQSVLSS